jgi:hypothetical protein
VPFILPSNPSAHTSHLFKCVHWLRGLAVESSHTVADVKPQVQTTGIPSDRAELITEGHLLKVRGKMNRTRWFRLTTKTFSYYEKVGFRPLERSA